MSPPCQAVGDSVAHNSSAVTQWRARMKMPIIWWARRAPALRGAAEQATSLHRFAFPLDHRERAHDAKRRHGAQEKRGWQQPGAHTSTATRVMIYRYP